METKIFKPNEIHLLADLAKEGAIIAFPTETVYGLGVVYDNEEAFNNLVKVKDRKIDKPFTLMLDYTRDIGNYAILNNKITNLIARRTNTNN